MMMKPLIIILLFIIAGTFLSHLIGEPSGSWAWRLNKLNLAREENIATWFESVVFLICGLSFALVGWSSNTPDSFGLLRRLFQTVALVCCFFAADEVLQLHEEMGEKVDTVTTIFLDTILAKVEFSWILMYGPVVLVGLAIFIYVIKKHAAMSNTFKIAQRAKIFLIVAVCSVPTILAFEAIEGYLWSLGNHQNWLPFFEESVEIIALYSFIRFNTIIAIDNDL